MKDKTTNQSRGFGFVKFKDPNCVGTVLASRPHTLDGRNVSAPQPSSPAVLTGPGKLLPRALVVVPGVGGGPGKESFPGLDSLERIKALSLGGLLRVNWPGGGGGGAVLMHCATACGR